MGFPGDGSGQQCLARARLAGEEHASWDTGAELAVALGVAQEVDDLGELLFGVVDAGDVSKGGTRLLGLVLWALDLPNMPIIPPMPPARLGRAARTTRRSPKGAVPGRSR